MKNKLKLSDLKVKSFVTELSPDFGKGVKGGALTVDGIGCDLTVTIFDSSPQKCKTNTLCATTP